MSRYILTTQQSNDAFMASQRAKTIIEYYDKITLDALAYMQLQIDTIEHMISYYEFNSMQSDPINRRTEILHMWLACEGLEDKTEPIKLQIARYNVSMQEQAGMQRLLLKVLESEGF